MKRSHVVVVVFVATLAVRFAVRVYTQDQTQDQKLPGPLRIAPVKEDLYMISGEGGNVAVYVTDEGVILVDDMFDRNHPDIMAQVVSVTDQPVRYVLNTHQHDDHAGGDLKMMDIAEVIAHGNVRTNLTDIQQPYYEDTPGTPIGLPRITFSDTLSVYLGGREVRAVHFGRGHTDGDVIIYFPDLGVIHSGDLFLATGGRQASVRPDRPAGVNIYIDYAQGGSFLEWTETLDRALELEFDTVIPGHGPVSNREEMVRFRADLETMRDRMAGLIRGGATKQEVVDTFERDYGWRATGCPPSPPTAGCLQFQQMDALIAEMMR